MFFRTKAKALISYMFDWETYSRWPLSIGTLKYDAKVAYGPIECVLFFASATLIS